MAKKKVSKPLAKTPAKPTKRSVGGAKKTPTIKKVAKRAAAVATKKVVKGTSSSSAKTAPKPASPTKAVSPAPPEVSLGRPLVTQEEKLFMLFHGDYLARQVFEFLRVQTVKELEQFSPQQIVHMMSKPIRTTVDRIRQRLAEMKRALRDDEQYAAEFRQQRGEK